MNQAKLRAILSLAQLAAARDLLTLLAQEGTAQQVGRKTMLLAHLVCPEAVGSQRQLAKRMGVSPGRVGQMASKARRMLSS